MSCWDESKCLQQRPLEQVEIAGIKTAERVDLANIFGYEETFTLRRYAHLIARPRAVDAYDRRR